MNLSKINIPRFNVAHGVPEMTETGLGYWVRSEDASKEMRRLRRKCLIAYAVAASSAFGLAVMSAVFLAHTH